MVVSVRRGHSQCLWVFGWSAQRYLGCNSHADLVEWWSGHNPQAAPRPAPSGSPDLLPPSVLFRRLVFPSAVLRLSGHFATAGEHTDSKQWHAIDLLRCGHVSIPIVGRGDIFTIPPYSQAQRQGGPQSPNATGEYEMAGLQTPDRITDGNGSNAADGMTRFYNQVRSRLIFRQFFYASQFTLIKDIQHSRRSSTL